MKRIYLDNAATSFPKAPGVSAEIAHFIENDDINPYRTNSRMEESYFGKVEDLRFLLSSFFGARHPECIGFTLNATHAFNYIIKGLFKRGDHLIISSQEHNAVMRPLNQMGLEYSKIASSGDGLPDYSSLPSLLERDTKGIIINVAGNVSGALWPLDIVSEFANRHGLYLIVDSSQASPYVDINMDRMGISAIAFTGHKGFLGPEGTGGFVLEKTVAEKIEPLIVGGTGSESDKEEQPHLLPDKLSAGTENTIGLVGLAKAVKYVIDNRKELVEKELKMTRRLEEGLMKMKEIKIVGPSGDAKKIPIVSITSEYFDLSSLSSFLLSEGGIETRVGLHCAPSAHMALGTFPTGTLRFSPGAFTTEDEIDFTLDLVSSYLMRSFH